MFTLWLPPNVCDHGSQSTITGRSAARNGHTCRIICWFAASIRCVFSTPFGVPVDPEVKRIFAIPSGLKDANAAATATLGSVASRADRSCTSGYSPLLAITGPPGSASSAGPKALASSANTAPGLISLAIARIRAWPRLCKEYATLTGATGTPAVIAPSVISRWSTLLPDRISSGLLGPRPRSSSAWPIALAAATAWP